MQQVVESVNDRVGFDWHLASFLFDQQKSLLSVRPSHCQLLVVSPYLFPFLLPVGVVVVVRIRWYWHVRLKRRDGVEVAGRGAYTTSCSHETDDLRHTVTENTS